MPSFTHNSFVCRAETIEMSSMLFQRGCSRGLFSVSLDDGSIAALATGFCLGGAQASDLVEKAAEGREARPPSNYNMDMILTAM